MLLSTFWIGLTGGLSGGISSTIAGGNFWDGFRQGIITSGLNHVAHQIGGPSEKRQEIVRKAKSHNGSTDWELDGRNGRYGAGVHKCNIFVDDVLGEAGIYTPDPNGMSASLGLGSPVTAGQWADPNYNVPGWKIVSSPQAGDVVAYGTSHYSDATGHTGIMISSKLSIGASTTGVVRVTDFGSNPSHLPSDAHYVYRRYVGFPQLILHL